MFILAGVVLVVVVTIEASTVQNVSFSGAQGIIYSPGYPDEYGNQLNQYYTITFAQKSLNSCRHSQFYAALYRNQYKLWYTAVLWKCHPFLKDLGDCQCWKNREFGETFHKETFHKVDPDYFVHLTLYDFETEACCDKLYIWDGTDTSMPTIANVSGDATGMTFSSSGSAMTLLFNTDITGQERGFAIHYEMVLKDTQYSEPSTCQSGLFTSELGFVTSPNWPSNYPDEITCNYLMAMPQGRLMLTFVAFSTEACCDKVEIYDGPNQTYPKIATLSGSYLYNTTYYSTQQSLFLTFYSDYTESDKGFSAFYKQIF